MYTQDVFRSALTAHHGKPRMYPQQKSPVLPKPSSGCAPSCALGRDRQTDRWTGSTVNKVSSSAPGETRGREKAKGHFSFSTKTDGKERNR